MVGGQREPPIRKIASAFREPVHSEVISYCHGFAAAETFVVHEFRLILGCYNHVTDSFHTSSVSGTKGFHQLGTYHHTRQAALLLTGSPLPFSYDDLAW